jgi:hypothetical protein
MTAPLIAPLIPRVPGQTQGHGKPGTVRRLPVAAAPEVPAVPDDLVHGTGRMDERSFVGQSSSSGSRSRPDNRLVSHRVASGQGDRSCRLEHLP